MSCDNVVDSILKQAKQKPCKNQCKKRKRKAVVRSIIDGIEHKECTVCGASLPVNSDHFHKEKKMADGFVNQCKKCVLARQSKWQKDNKEKARAKSKRYRDSNREECNRKLSERSAKRDKRLSLAKPPWATWTEIEEVYRHAKELRARGGDAVVDHDIPIAGVLVCGLHCPENMKIVPKDDNSSKRNYHESEDILKGMDYSYEDIGKVRKGNYIDEEAVASFLFNN